MAICAVDTSTHPRLWHTQGSTRRQPGNVKAHTKTTATLAKKPSRVVHPVKLFWPKSRCFDYLYQEAEALLRNYPVQATICPYADSSSDEGEDSDEEDKKETN
ncbi:hypothetical protein ACEWY4_022047 [Coilia grayii]|uniref:Protein ripply2 n=1 Tax=Coilia grayii TaxID=363190 RepID=A0ABD1J563_9TELE